LNRLHCYACGSAANSREHVPPLCIFPEGEDAPFAESLRRDLITVPSCETHNLQKSQDDEYLMMILVAHFTNNEVAHQQMRTKVMRAWQRRPHLALTAVRNPQPAGLNGKETMVFSVDMPRFTRAMELITRGLIFHTTGTPWQGAVHTWGANMLASESPNYAKIMATSVAIREAMASIFAKIPFLGANPEVFRYQLYVPAPQETLGCAKLVFYEGLEIAAFFGPEA
jgi:hypothetical protein